MGELLRRPRERERAFADLLEQPVAAGLAGHELGKHAGIELMLGDQHAGGEALGRVIRQHRNLDAPEHRSLVQFVGDEVDRAAYHLVALRQRPGVGVEALVLWQKRGVDVDHPALPFGHEFRREQAHIAGERDIVCAGGDELLVNQGVEFGALEPLVAVGEGANPLRLG